jgi:hypothetical protein
MNAIRKAFDFKSRSEVFIPNDLASFSHSLTTSFTSWIILSAIPGSNRKKGVSFYFGGRTMEKIADRVKK